MIKKIVTLVVFLVMLSSSHALALSRGFEAYSYRPATDNGYYFTLWGSENLESHKYALGTVAVYAYRPLQLTRSGGGRLQGIIDNSLVQHFYAAIGVMDPWLSIGIDIPVGWWLDYRNPNVAGSAFGNKMALGDIRFNFKSEFLDINRYKVGIALVPYLSLPTGFGDVFMGSEGISGGGLLVFEAEPLSMWKIVLNTGIETTPKYDLRNMEKRFQYILSAGMSFTVSQYMEIVAEIKSQTRLSSPYSEKVESPVEALGGVKWTLGNSGFKALLGGSGGILKGSSAPAFSVFGGLSFSSRNRQK